MWDRHPREFVVPLADHVSPSVALENVNMSWIMNPTGEQPPRVDDSEKVSAVASLHFCT